MDRIIFGDNQFFGVNHMSEQTSMRQLQRFKSPIDIYRTLEYVNAIGIKSFMFTTHSQFEPVFEMMKKESKFDDFKLIPCMPYAHKYADMVAENGIVETIKKFVPGNKFLSGLKGLGSILSTNPVPIMQLLVDSEMKLLAGMNVEAIFLQNIVTDLLLGLRMHKMFREFCTYVKKKYSVKAGFITMNYVSLHDILVDELQINDALICTNINKIGFRMNPTQASVEGALAKKDTKNIAMSFMASGAIPPEEAADYLKSVEGVDSVLFGASSPSHIKETQEYLEKALS